MYGQGTAGAHVGGSVSGAVTGGSHVDPKGFLGLNWTGLLAAVIVGSTTAVITQLAVEHIRDRRKKQRKKHPESRAMALSLPVESE